MYGRLACALALLILNSSPLLAHSVNYSITRSEAIVIRAYFSEDGPMSYALAKVYSPDNARIEYQNGRTDKNGIFSFIPDRAGRWTITVIDESGHGLREEVMVDNKMRLAEQKSHGLTIAQKIFIAICIIWGAIGSFLYVKRNIHARKKETEDH